METALEKSLHTFSYPEGSFSAETVKIVKSAGFEVVMTITQKVVEVGENLLQMGRFGEGDWNGEEFKHRLNEFFLALTDFFRELSRVLFKRPKQFLML